MVIRIPRWANLTDDEQTKFKKMMMDAKEASDLGMHQAAYEIEEKARDYAFQQSAIKSDGDDEQL